MRFNRMIASCVFLLWVPLSMAQIGTPRGYLITPAELTDIATKATAGTQPYADAVKAIRNYANVGTDAVAVASDNPTYWPSATGWNDYASFIDNCNGSPDYPEWLGTSNSSAGQQGGGAALTWAKVLVWKLTGNAAYAADAVTHLRNAYGTNFTWGSVWSGGNNCMLNLSHYIPDYIMAADMLEGYSGWTTTDKTNMLNWLHTNIFQKIAYCSQTCEGNWGTSASDAEAFIADYNVADGVSLVDRFGTSYTAAQAWADAKLRFTDRVNGNTYMTNTTVCLSGHNGPGKGYRADGGIPPELARYNGTDTAAQCEALYPSGPSYPSCNNNDNSYSWTNLLGSTQMAELFLRRGDNSIYEHINGDNTGSIRRAFLFLLNNPNDVTKSCDSFVTIQRSSLEWAYRYYRVATFYNELTTSFSGTVANGLGSRFIGSVRTRTAHFGTLLAGFATNENPGLPPVSASAPGGAALPSTPTGVVVTVH